MLYSVVDIRFFLTGLLPFEASLNKPTTEKTNKKTTDRTKFLNVIYFVDSQRTHAFKISISSSILAIMSISLIVCWSIISTALLINQAIDSQQKSEKIQSLLSTIFSYETKHDLVYEKTYPKRSEGWATENDQEFNQDLDQAIKGNKKEPTKDNVTLAAKAKEAENAESKSKKLLQKKAKLAKKARIAMKEKATKKAKAKDSKIATIPISKNGQSPEPEQQMNETEPETPQDLTTPVGADEQVAKKDFEAPPIIIEQTELSTTDDSVEFKFALKNLDSPNLTTGSVIGIATFTDESGNIREVLAPPGIEFDKDIPRRTLPVNHRYSIRYYKKKILIFKKPEGFDGWVQKIRLIIRDPEGNKKEILYNPPKSTAKGHKEVSR